MGTWVDLSKEMPGGSNSPARTTPVPFGGESDYMRMLREAQVTDPPLHKNLCLHLSRPLQVRAGQFCISLTACRSAPHPSFEHSKMNPNKISLTTRYFFHFPERNFSADVCTSVTHHISFCFPGKLNFFHLRMLISMGVRLSHLLRLGQDKGNAIPITVNQRRNKSHPYQGKHQSPSFAQVSPELAEP